jgi:hypothetical protein
LLNYFRPFVFLPEWAGIAGLVSSGLVASQYRASAERAGAGAGAGAGSGATLGLFLFCLILWLTYW